MLLPQVFYNNQLHLLRLFMMAMVFRTIGRTIVKAAAKELATTKAVVAKTAAAG